MITTSPKETTMLREAHIVTQDTTMPVRRVDG
jgi:hypothetical protein